MSNRARRDIMEMRHRLHATGKGDAEEEVVGAEVVEEEEEEPKNARRNVFDLLVEDGDEDTKEEEEEDEQEEEEEDEEEEEESKNKRRRKKNKQRQQDSMKESDEGKKARRKRRKNKKGTTDGEGIDSKDKKEEQEQEKEKDEKKDADRVLVVQSRYFDPDQEMRAMFGADALAAAGLGRTAERWPPNSVVRPRPEWGRGAGATGLGMRRLGGRRFAFEWAPRYAAAQRAYEAAAASLDVQEVLELLRDAPWHADALYQVALVRLQLGEAAAAEELLARSLYAMQAAFHHLFGTRGDCRLRYADHPQNRTFLLALFRYAALLAARGCARAALELTKLLYTLDPADPLGALLVMDHYAVKAAQYDVLDAMAALPPLGRDVDGTGGDDDNSSSNIETTTEAAKTTTTPASTATSESGESDATVDAITPAELPNVRFSTALARFRQECTRLHKDSGKDSKDCEEDHKESGELLERALALYPLVGRLLLARDDKNAHAQQLLAGRLFGEAAVAETPEALAHIAAIFVERNGDLWHEPDVHAWFLAHCDAAAARAESRAAAAGAEGGKSEVDEDEKERRALYARCLASAVLRGAYRHLLVSDFGATVAQLPRDAVMDLIAQDGGGNFRAFDEAARPVVRAPTNNILRLLLYTLLPWVPVPNAPAQ